MSGCVRIVFVNADGGKIRKLREEAGISQERLALDARVGRDVIAGLENGRRGTLPTKLNMIAVALGVKREEIEANG